MDVPAGAANEVGSVATLVPRNRVRTFPAGAAAAGGGPRPDCRSCDLRARCISYGWMSPGGIWFENTVVLRPPQGCRGYVGRGADIQSHFGEDAERVD